MPPFHFKRPLLANGSIERLHHSLLDEHFRITGRTKWYETIEEKQQDLDAYLVQYNIKRPHQGRMMNGKPPAEMFLKGLPTV
jgi:transposase InsO family protein